MLDFSRTKILESHEPNVAVGFTFTAEGQAMIADYTGGVFGVKPSAGTANDRFYGVSLAQQITPTEFPEIVEFVSTGSYTLPHTPIGGSVLVWNVTDATALTTDGAGPTDGEYVLTGNVVTTNVAQAGDTIRVQYRYIPTTLEALELQGDIPPGGAASLLLGTMGAIVKGQVATSVYDTSVNWNVTNPVVTLGAGGRFTIGGSGPQVPDAVILNIPSAADPYLVMQI
jgi:hypothetical protein